MFTKALVRTPGENFGRGLTTSRLGPPSYELILNQHGAYIETLRSLGLEVIVLPAEPRHPDGYFVEDTAVVTPHLAVITNPGAPSRRGEEATIEPVLSGYRRTFRVRPPAMIDGGDVLMVENHFFIGVSERTNRDGALALGRLLEKHGHTWSAVKVGSGLHLKSSVNYLGQGTLIVTPAYAGREEFKAYSKVILDKKEGYAANTLWLNGTLLTPAGFPKVRPKLEPLGLPIIELDVSEVRKMDGGLTCLSLRF
jgi:dimethylargininase